VAVIAAIAAARRQHTLRRHVGFSAKTRPSQLAAGSTEGPQGSVAVQEFIDSVNAGYEAVHRDFEEQFWGTKMALKEGDFSTEELTRTKGIMEAFLADPQRLQETRQWLQSGQASEDQAKVLGMFERTFQCYIMEDEGARAFREESTRIEGTLQAARNEMKLGAEVPGKGFVELSSVGLRNMMRTDSDEAARKACFEGLQSIGPFVCDHGFVELVKLRNRMAKALGYVDFYDYKVTQAEGFGKERLFGILDTLEEGTREQLQQARRQLVAEKGEDALKPWNTDFMLAGDVTKKLDPYFPFEKAVDRWVRSYAALGIDYKGATMTLDLLDRKGKYSNGFCHWTQPAWVRADGSWQPSVANFTSLADPQQVGSGYTALTTLMHEAGHAAHMANIAQPSPLFAQERAPMSVAYAENQSMLMDSLVGDASWRGRYGRDREGKVVPWELLEEDIRCRHPYAVFALRRMLSVPYFERALYELPEAELTPERVQGLAAEVEERVGGGASPLPVIAIPHILADEASCYYHGYVLAEMAVQQTREHLLEAYGRVVDNPAVGPLITEKYWRPGCSVPFLDLVKGLTGKELSGDAWKRKLEKPLEEVLRSEQADYEEAVQAGAAAEGDVDIGMRVRLVHGDDLIGDSLEDGSFAETNARFEAYVQKINA